MRVKLVRDRAPITRGAVRPANSLAGRQLALINKLHEEAEEIAKDGCAVEEYADLFEAMLELMRLNGVGVTAMTGELERKRRELGGFSRGLVWTEDVPEVEPLAEGYPEASN